VGQVCIEAGDQQLNTARPARCSPMRCVSRAGSSIESDGSGASKHVWACLEAIYGASGIALATRGCWDGCWGGWTERNVFFSYLSHPKFVGNTGPP
jgi:hypothetical protein